ncbi:MAG TPA: ferritin [Acidimicrobiia bacterium]|jgi:ferritin
MKMNDALAQAFSDQVTMELSSSVAYLQMSAWFDNADLPGMASWMRIQSEEERTHALRFMDFVLDRGNEVTIGASGAPPTSFASARAVFEAALAQEQAVTGAIRNLYLQAAEEKDVESYPLLEWFLTEQVEEEATVQKILGQLGHAGPDGSALLMLDRELGSRTTSPDAG